ATYMPERSSSTGMVFFIAPPPPLKITPMVDATSPEILRESCDYAYRRLLAGCAGTVVLSLVLTAFLWRSQPLDMVLFWQAVMLGLAGALGVLYWRYRSRRDADPPQVWTRRLAIGAAALGAGWGYGAAVFFPGGQDQQVFIAFIVAIVTAGALPIFSTLWWVFAIYAAAVMLPFNVVLFAYGTYFLRLLGAAVPLLYIANVIAAYELGRAFQGAYRL